MIELEINSALESLADEILNLYRKQLSDNNINASSKLSDTATVDIRLNDNHLRVYFNLQEYWKYIENGTRGGGWVPIRALEEWIRVKPIIPNARDGKIPTTTQLAYMIRHKIHREGIPKREPLKKMQDSSEFDTVKDAIKTELVRQLRQIILRN